jgi:hypothetical protein
VPALSPALHVPRCSLSMGTASGKQGVINQAFFSFKCRFLVKHSPVMIKQLAWRCNHTPKLSYTTYL